MYSDKQSSGKHLLLDAKEIKNADLLGSLAMTEALFDGICSKYGFTILQKCRHEFEPQGFSLVYLLAESHMSVHTFPEKAYAAIDVYTCKEYADNRVYEEIHRVLVEAYGADLNPAVIVDRLF